MYTPTITTYLDGGKFDKTAANILGEDYQSIK